MCFISQLFVVLWLKCDNGNSSDQLRILVLLGCHNAERCGFFVWGIFLVLFCDVVVAPLGLVALQPNATWYVLLLLKMWLLLDSLRSLLK